MDNLLFNKYDLRSVLEGNNKTMIDEIQVLPEDRLLNTPIEDLIKYFTEKFTIECPKINEAGIQAGYDDAKIDVSRRRFEYAAFDRNGPVYVTGTRITFYIPFEGDKGLFDCRPSTFTYNPPHADVRDSELLIVYERTSSEVENIKTEFQRELEYLKQYLGWIVKDMTPFNTSVSAIARQRIEARRGKVLKDRGLVENIGFPLRHREGISPTYIAPHVKRKIVPRLPPVSTIPFTPEPILDFQEYENILSIISNMVIVMENSPQAFKGMKEEDLRQHFLVQLNGQYQGSATGETFNFQGKTDILIRVGGKNIFVAECKFWSGPEKLTEALDQLQGYTTWRDSKIALLIFNRNRALTTVLSKIPEVVKKHPNFKNQLEYKPETGFRFIFGHRDDMKRDLTLTVVVFEIPT